MVQPGLGGARLGSPAPMSGGLGAVRRSRMRSPIR